MDTFLAGLDTTFAAFLRCSVQATVLVPALLMIRGLRGKRLRAAGRRTLWWIVVGRLLLPWSPGAPFSLFGVVDVQGWTAAKLLQGEASATGTTRIDRSPPNAFTPKTPENSKPGADAIPKLPVSKPAATRARSWNTRHVVAGLWSLGCLAVLGGTVRDSLRMRRWVRTRTTQPEPELSALFAECRRQMGVHVPVALRVGAWVPAPAVWGFWSPTLLVPASLESNASHAQLRHILLHELAHVARHDLRWGLLLRLVQALHWFNPVVPWLLRRMRLDREIATDAMVLGVTGPGDRSAYGETLLMLASGTHGPSAFGGTALGTTDGPADMEERIRAIAAFTTTSAKGRVAIASAVALATVCWTNAITPAAPENASRPHINLGAAGEMLPRGEDLGPGWSNRVTSLVERGTPALEYFDPGVFEPARVAVRSHVAEGTAFCDMSYFRGGSFAFDAWLRRLESANLVETEWNNLRHTPLLPRLSDGKVIQRSIRRVGNLEVILYEGDSRTLWMASGPWILNLNLQKKMPYDEVFSVAEIFARRLTAGHSPPARPIEGPSPAEEAGWYTVHSMGDLYTPVRKVHTNRVAMSRAFKKPDNTYAYFTITNSESVPILLWNVRVQVMTNGSGGNPGGWKTVSSDYPSCVSGIPAGTTGDACVLPPSRAPWRVALLYTPQSLDGRPIANFPPHLRGDHEIISATEETVEPSIDGLRSPP